MMFLKPLLTITILLTSMIPVLIIPTGNSTVTQNGALSLSMVKLKTNATITGPCNQPSFNPNGSSKTISGSLYGNIRIILNVTVSGTNATYPIGFGNFFLIITQPNTVVANSTNINNESPTNRFQGFLLFPNLPVILVLSFAPVCVTATSVAELLYLDGTFSFTFILP